MMDEQEVVDDKGSMVTVTESVPEPEKVSLTKTTKKFKVTVSETTPVGGLFNTEKYKSFSFDTSDEGAGDASTSSALSSDGAAIDPATWLKKKEPTLNEMGETINAGYEYVDMFWLDACEINGVLYVFGKVPVTEPAATSDGVKAEGRSNEKQRFVSCCVQVNGNLRNLFVLNRVVGPDSERASWSQVHEELSKILLSPECIPTKKGQNFMCKPVRRKYAFEHGDIPREEMEYLKVNNLSILITMC